MSYIHIPVDFANPTQENFEQFRVAMDSLPDACVHVHCIANFRVSAFIYKYRRDVRGENEACARADLLAIWQPDGVWAKFIGR